MSKQHTNSWDCPVCNPPLHAYVTSMTTGISANITDPMQPVEQIVWRTVPCPTCGTIAGLACIDDDYYRQPQRAHPARIEAFYDLTEMRGQ